jgi:putative membrane protein insertion efficiency factor
MTKMNDWFGRGLMLLIDAYRLSLGLVLPNSCRFHPTCSCYLRQAVSRHGTWRGLRLGLGRMLRCHPFHPGGYDPVPEIITKNKA